MYYPPFILEHTRKKKELILEYCNGYMCCCMMEASSVFFKTLRLSLKIDGNLRKFSENVQTRLSGLRTTFGEFSEIFGKCWEIFKKSKNVAISMFIS